MAQSQQKSYADRGRRPLEFEVGDHAFLKVMPKKGLVRFGKQGKLSSRYIRPFIVGIVERVGIVAYQLALRRAYQVFTRCSTSPCSGSILQI